MHKISCQQKSLNNNTKNFSLF